MNQAILSRVSLLVISIMLSFNAQGAIFTVSNTNDNGVGSLRRAITNANSTAGRDTVEFNIPGNGPFMILPSAALPIITDSVVLDGSTQPGFSGVPLIEINGALAGSDVTGFMLDADNCVIRGLTISRFTGTAIVLRSDGNLIESNYIGTDVTGTVDRGNAGNGILVYSSENVIGGTTTQSRNIISGNDARGILISTPLISPAPEVKNNVVQGNYIGTDASGSIAIGNRLASITIVDSDSNKVGGTEAGAGNVISASLEANGVAIISNIRTVTGNVVQGNRIGTDASGRFALGNRDGIFIQDATNCMIGGTEEGAGNIISANQRFGILIRGGLAVGNTIEGNYIGTDITGTAKLGNFSSGIIIADASGNRVGGTSLEARNIISGNRNDGINIDLFAPGIADDNQVLGNYIGTDVTGTMALGNNGTGVLARGVRNTFIANNLIAGNVNGIIIDGSVHDARSTENNTIQGNYIGTDANGTAIIENRFNGITLIQASNNIIGGDTEQLRNVIAGNGQNGIEISGEGGPASGNIIQGNYIGVAANGTSILPNVSVGIFAVNLDASNLTIGGIEPGKSNVVTGQDINVLLSSDNNLVQGNLIGTDAFGEVVNTNNRIGLWLTNGSNNTIGGFVTGAENVIKSHGDVGVLITDTSNENLIVRNEIALNDTNGIRVNGDGLGNTFRENSIYGNGALGIDLIGDGVTTNDSGDNDTGPNDLQNFPFITSVDAGDTLSISGTLNSTPNRSFRIEVYGNKTCDISGFGEGRTFLGADSIITNNNGDGFFTITLPDTTFEDQFFTATATGPSGSTSEFGLCFEAILPPAAPSLNAPEDQVSGVIPPVTFSWSETDRAEVYHFQLSTEQDFSSVTLGDSTLTQESIVVESLAEMTMYYWRVRAGNSGGWGAFSPVRSFTTGMLTAISEPDPETPRDFVLQQNYPNPFNPQTTIRFALPQAAHVLIEVFDVLGRRVEILMDAQKLAGWHDVHFDAKGMSNGVYVYRIQAGEFTQIRKMILIK